MSTSNASKPDSAADPSPMERSGTFTPGVIEDIQIKAELARYRIRGLGLLRPRTWATFDDLTFVPGTLTRIPLEGYREKCSTSTVLGTRFASKPLELDIPLMVTGMSYGALSRNAKTALSRGARMAGTSTTTGDGGMLDVEPSESRVMVYEALPSRYGINIQHLRAADAIELTIGQGAKPGTGGLLLGSKVSPEIAAIRDLPAGVDQRSPCRHPDFLGPDDMVIKIEELREATDCRCRSSASSAPAGSTTTSSWRPSAAPTSWSWTAWRGAPAPRRTCCRSTPASRPWQPCARPGRPWRSWGCTASSTSSSPAASATAATPPRPWPW